MKAILAAVFLVLLVSVSACTQDINYDRDVPHIALILGPGGTGDRGFNDATLSGLLRAELAYDIDFELSMPAVGDDIYAILRPLAESGRFDLIIVMGAGASEAALRTVAPLFPNQMFSHVDSTLDMPNVSAVQTNWVEQTFFTGVLAGLGTKSDMPMASSGHIVGVLVGMDTFPMRQGILGFKAGAMLVNPYVEVLYDFIGSFSDIEMARTMALDMYNQGADFILSIGGAAGLGIHQAAREAGRYSFASGANTNFLDPDHIVATALRDVAGIVYNEISAFVGGYWTGGLHLSGIAEGAVGYDRFNSNVVVPAHIMQTVRNLYAQIVAGALVLPSDFDALDAWLEMNSDILN